MLRLRAARGVVRSLRIYYGDAERGAAMDRLYCAVRRAGRSRFRHRRACRRPHRVVPADWRARRRDRAAAGAGEHVAADLRPRPNVTIEAAAVGRRPGSVELNLNVDNPTVATASADFIARSRGCAPAGRTALDRRSAVPLTTVDALIATAWHARLHQDRCRGFRGGGSWPA